MAIIVLETGCGAEDRSGRLVKGQGQDTLDKNAESLGTNGLVNVMQKVHVIVCR